MKRDLKSFSLPDLEQILADRGEKTYHARQLGRWIYERGVADFDQMTDLSKSCRHKLSEEFFISALPLINIQTSKDESCKYIFRLVDGFDIESVLIRDNERLTLCLSTQVGCRQGCRFCLTGRMGLIRNLSAHEIVDQIIQVRNHLPSEETTFNIVLMGMGEPLDNYQQTIEAIRRVTSPLGLKISPRKITLSTAGLVPQLYDLAKEDLGINLAISLNAPSDEIRNSLMPVNKRYNLTSLLQALKDYPVPARRRITIEYVLIEGVNSSAEAARQLAQILGGLPCKVNLIPFNTHPDLPFSECSEQCIEQFQEILHHFHLTATVRRSKGRDVKGACGQLGYDRYYKVQQEKEKARP